MSASFNVKLTRLSDVKPERVEWYAPGWLARGKIAIMDGDPGDGKSTLSIDWAASVTRGHALPGGSPMDPRGVVLITPEDGVADTIRPRCEAAGADLARMVILEGSTNPLDPDAIINPPSLPRDIEIIRAAVEAVDAGLIIIDPLFAALDANVSAKVDQDIRRALTPLARMADEMGVAVLVIRHLNKSAGGSPVYRGGGSIGIIGVARLGMLVGRDPDDPEIRVLASTKVNIGKMPASLRFRLVESPGNSDVATIEYLGESAYSARELLASPNEKAQEEEETGPIAEAKDWLFSWLAGGSKAANYTKQMAIQDGIAKRTLERAKADMGVIAFRSGGVAEKGSWFWRLPNDDEQKAKNATESPKSATETLRTPPPDESRGVADIDEHGRVTVPEDEIEELVQQLIEGGQDAIDGLRTQLADLSLADRDASLQAIARAEALIREAA